MSVARKSCLIFDKFKEQQVVSRKRSAMTRQKVSPSALSPPSSQQVLLCPEQYYSPCFLLAEVFGKLQLSSLSGCLVGQVCKAHGQISEEVGGVLTQRRRETAVREESLHGTSALSAGRFLARNVALEE